MHDGATDGLMTVGQLSRRTGLSIKAIRRYEALGLIYSAGRSEGNYRLFDESALWCVQVIETLRSLGLTIKEIDQLARAHLDRPDVSIGPRLAALLDASERRIDHRIAELAAVRRHISRYRVQHAAALSGRRDGDLFGSDPRRRAA
jgi:MerR family transcriptional regulator, copper efflux regulator